MNTRGSVRKATWMVSSLTFWFGTAAFEVMNFATSLYAWQILLGGVSFLGVDWAVIITVAFVLVDTIGLALLFDPETQLERKYFPWLAFMWGLAGLADTLLSVFSYINAIVTNPQPSVILASISDGNMESNILLVAIALACCELLIRVLLMGSAMKKGNLNTRG